MIVGLLARQLDQSFSAIQGLNIEKDAAGRIIIKLRAFGPFSPNCLDGMPSELDLACPSGIESVGITLRVVPHTAPRGTWFPYEAVFNSPSDVERLVFTGVHIQFSNIWRLSLLAEGRPAIAIANPFYRI
ncbi:hypothetical protein K8R04_00260 [Candidatus Uhrbacteria bacterium]|nr:hypothetical protein [Candidatus Uhrbacteria bacterium]